MKTECVFLLLSISTLTQSTSAATVQAQGLRGRVEALQAKEEVHHDLFDDSNSTTEPQNNPTRDHTLWSDHSAFSPTVTSLFAVIWVLGLGSVPLLVYFMDSRAITFTAVLLANLMWLALFGGLYLFTHIILFQSPHFGGKIRPLTTIECCYFMTQIITTVGYGDITPAKPRGKLFVGIYVCLAFFVIALLVSQMQGIVAARLAKYREKLKKHQKHQEEAQAAEGSDEPEGGAGGKSPKATSGQTKSIGKFAAKAAATEHHVSEFRPPKPKADDVIGAVAGFGVVACIWISFFHLYPGEEKTLGDACYMALITLTTVGFGAVTPVTEGGMMFAAFFMFLGSGTLVGVVTNSSAYILRMSEWEAWTPDQFHKNLKQSVDEIKEEAAGANGGKKMSEVDFLIAMLAHRHVIEKADIDSIRTAYKDVQTPRPAEGSK